MLDWKSAQELGIAHIYTGQDQIYGGGGYQVEFPYTLTSEEYEDQMTALFHDSTLFDSKTLALVLVNFDFYEPSVDMFVSIEMGLEFESRTSEVFPGSIDINFYISEYTETPLMQFVMACMIMKLLLCLYTMWLMYIKIRYR